MSPDPTIAASVDTDLAHYGTCPACGQPTFPVPELLPCGHTADPQLRPLREAGTVYSWTRADLEPLGQTVLAMVDFLDGQLRVTGPVLDGSSVAIGDRLWLVEAGPELGLPYGFRVTSVAG